MIGAELIGSLQLNGSYRKAQTSCATVMDSRRCAARIRLCVVPLLVVFLGGVARPVTAGHTSDHVAASGMAIPAPDTLDVLKRLGLVAAPTASEEEFLQPDAAFALSVAARDATTVVARWELADTYYLYRDKFRFVAKAPATLELGAPVFPPGKIKRDEYFGQVEVYYHAVEAVLPIERRETGATRLILDVRYQGCTDKGLCYPPVTKTVTVSLPPQ